MSIRPADILAAANNFNDFQNVIISLDGNFPFGTEEMMGLGRVYFTRYPDSSVDRNMENIRMGYRIVRVCILEKILQGIDNRHRYMVREMLDNMLLMEDILRKLVNEMGMEAFEEYRRTVTRNLDELRSVIEELPRGMIKERFVGGISKFFNEMYLLNNAIEFLKGKG
ncbi:MAG TPA: hypothetical protein PLA65_01330 [Spirochaetota bacterium]|nr:hypothetical protein [Spirochaetota bacterium]HOD16876.1 hypothetical protein [Spirochaetota bacterium]HPG50351.1 hypothetical protein [Spirochaetota bacterium]HPN10675.1 hypothetical protein [Spirochaetota bacterium]